MASIPQKVIYEYLRHDKKFPHVWCAGCSNGIETEILQGLQAGDRIITTGYNDLNDGQAITLP